MDYNVEQLIPKLVEAVMLMMSPNTPHTQRHGAYQVDIFCFSIAGSISSNYKLNQTKKLI